MKALRKCIAACIVSILLCLGLLAGTTFAWFTDSITNSGNQITAGQLAIEAYSYNIGTGGMTMQIPGSELNDGNQFKFETSRTSLDGGTPVIDEENWEPGQSNAKLMQVRNVGTLNAKVSLSFTTSGALTNALWLDFIQVTPGTVEAEDGAASGSASVTGTFTKREMSTLSTFASALTFDMAPEANLFFVLVYGMDEDAGNEYQNTSFTASVTVLATQATGETDGFNNPDYDEDAEFPPLLKPEDGETLNETHLANALNSAGSEPVMLGADVTVRSSTRIYNDATLDLNDNKLISSKQVTFGKNASYADVPVDVTIKNGTVVATNSTSGILRFSDSCSATFSDVTFVGENGTQKVVRVYAEKTDGNNTYVFENCTFDNAWVSFEGSSGDCYEYDVVFKDCTFDIDSLSNGGCAVAIDDCLYGKVTFEDCTFNVTANGNGTAAIKLDTYPDYLNGNKIELVLNNVTITGKSTEDHFGKKSPTPVYTKDYIDGIENTVTVTELGTCSYKIDDVDVDYKGDALSTNGGDGSQS